MKIIDKIFCKDINEQSDINDLTNRLQIGYVCSVLSGVFISMFGFMIVENPFIIIGCVFLVLAILATLLWTNFSIRLFDVIYFFAKKVEDYDNMVETVEKYKDGIAWIQTKHEKLMKKNTAIMDMIGELNEYLMGNNIDISAFTEKKLKQITGDD